MNFIVVFFSFITYIAIKKDLFSYTEYLWLYVGIVFWSLAPALNISFNILEVSNLDLYYTSYFPFAIINGLILLLYKPNLVCNKPINSLNNFNKIDRITIYAAVSINLILVTLFILFSPSYEKFNELPIDNYLKSYIVSIILILSGGIIVYVASCYNNLSMFFKSVIFLVLVITILPTLFTGGRFGILNFILPLWIIFSRMKIDGFKIKAKYKIILAFISLIGFISITLGPEIRVANGLSLKNISEISSFTDTDPFSLFIKHISIKLDSVFYATFYDAPNVSISDTLVRIMKKILFLDTGIAGSPDGTFDFFPKFQVAQSLHMGDSGNVGVSGIAVDFLSIGYFGIILNIFTLFILIIFYKLLWKRKDIFSRGFSFALIGFPAFSTFNFTHFERFTHIYYLLIIYLLIQLFIKFIKSPKLNFSAI